MKIKNEYPPNYEIIRIAVNPPEHAIFCYGDTIYNPSGQEVPDDVQHHEEVHTKQQKNPDLWWDKWINDKDFRYQQELEAYSAQYQYIKERCPQSITKMALFELASNLKNLYGIDISHGVAESNIRNYATQKGTVSR